MKETSRKHTRIISLCLLAAAVISVTACTNGKREDHADTRGTMDIDFGEDGIDPDHTGRDLDSASFDVIVEEPGGYQVCYTASEFVGDCGINWRTEDRTDQ